MASPALGGGAGASWTLNAEALAALGAACVQHSATATGGHAHQETVRTGAADLGALISAFHVGYSSYRQGVAIIAHNM